jgi:hypothetical protein
MLETPLNITLLGVFCMGGFVGFILGWILLSTTNLTVKVGAAVISAALAGAPVIFMDGLAFQRWMYPIGLVLGLAWTRIFSARVHSNHRSRRARTLAWLDIAAIVGATLVVLVCAAFVTVNGR